MNKGHCRIKNTMNIKALWNKELSRRSKEISECSPPTPTSSLPPDGRESEGQETGEGTQVQITKNRRRFLPPVHVFETLVRRPHPSSGP